MRNTIIVICLIIVGLLGLLANYSIHKKDAQKSIECIISGTDSITLTYYGGSVMKHSKSGETYCYWNKQRDTFFTRFLKQCALDSVTLSEDSILSVHYNLKTK